MRNRATVTASAILLLVAIGIIVAVGTGKSDRVEITEVSTNIVGGLVGGLDVQVVGLSNENEELLFAVDWSGNPQVWNELSRTWEGSHSATIRLVPSSAGDIPPNVPASDGQVRARSFKVRVSRLGESVFSFSSLVSPPPVDAALTNPEFRYWDRSLSPSSPLGWHVSNRTTEIATARVGPIGSRMGLSAILESPEAEPAAWTEASLFQIVPSLSQCYQVELRGNNLFEQSKDGDPVAATGIQVTQGSDSVWWVLSGSTEPKTTLQANAAIVHVPAFENKSLSFRLDVQDVKGGELTVGSEAVIKVFNATSRATHEPLITSVSRVQTTEC